MSASTLAPASPAAGAVSRARRFWRSTIGKKVVMAVTGLLMIGYLITHVLANLEVFRGPATINAYAAFLKSTGVYVWVARGVLLGALALHVLAAWQLTRRKDSARPLDYAGREPQVSTFAARSIRWGGVVLLVFIVYHILHFTVGTLHPAFDHRDVYGNVISAFQIWWVALLYVAFMVVLGLHLYHGVWSSLRTLGLTRPSSEPLQRRLTAALAIALYGGFTIIPIAIFLRIVR